MKKSSVIIAIILLIIIAGVFVYLNYFTKIPGQTNMEIKTYTSTAYAYNFSIEIPSDFSADDLMENALAFRSPENKKIFEKAAKDCEDDDVCMAIEQGKNFDFTFLLSSINPDICIPNYCTDAGNITIGGVTGKKFYHKDYNGAGPAYVYSVPFGGPYYTFSAPINNDKFLQQILSTFQFLPSK